MPTSIEAAYGGSSFSPYGSERHSEREEEWMVQNTFRIPRDQERNQSSDFHYDENISTGNWSREDGDDEWNEPDENGMMAMDNFNYNHDNGSRDNVQADGDDIEVVGRNNLTNSHQHQTNEEPGWLESIFNAMCGPINPDSNNTNSRGGGQTKRSNDTTSASLTSYEVSLDERSNDNSEKEEPRRRRICCCFSCCRCCSPGMRRCLSAFVLLAALAVIGVFSGRAIRNRAPSSEAGGGGDNIMDNVPSSSKVDYPTATPTAAPATTLHPNYQATESYPEYSSNVTVGVYYYPWHGENFHNGGGYIREQLVPQQMPALGEYDDSDPATISQHLAWSRQANIGLWVTSWWGPDRLEDTTTLDVIMNHEDIGDLKIALHYETTNRVSVRRDYSTERVVPDINHMCEHYFDHPNYFKIDGRPVVVVYLTRALENIEGKLEEVALLMRTTAAKCGHSLYLVGDHVFNEPPDDSATFGPYLYLDAVTNYDVYGSMGSNDVYAGPTVVDEYYEKQARWRSQAIEQNCRFIPAVSPGFNDRGVRLWDDHQALSRQLTKDSPPGSFFSYSLNKAVPLVDPKVQNLLLVNSFNEWHEDSQIEPVVGGISSIPELLTNGIEYEPYGDLYLNILREATTDYA